MAPRTPLRIGAATAALVLGLTACGDGDNGGGGTADAGDEFTFGIIYPQTGPLAFLGPPQEAAASYAIEDINNAGGILGTDVPALNEADEAGDAGQANDAANNLVADEVNAVIGAGASAMTQAIYDTITGAGIVQCSGANTAPELSDIDDGGYYFRTAPSDLMAGPVLAQRMVEDGHVSTAIVARADDYGSGYLDAVESELEGLGADVVHTDTYDPDATNFDTVVNGVNGSDADAVALISFEEGAQLMAELLEAGIDGDQLYLTDGLNDPDLGTTVNENDPDVINGTTGVTPGADAPEFDEGLRDFDPDLDVLQFAPQKYDCVTTIALAAESAQSTDPGEYVEHISDVTRPPGTECTSFEECRDLLDDGDDIDYQGVSGNIDLDDNGDPTTATFEVFHFDDDGYGIDDYVDYAYDD
ncbi:ABC transporter substrate-binding protein [Nocardiopsis sp. HNM0947]|uniref:ABC transporter substrate-binding protein n=1 Tax=Nocardiopsis coralli TaxID=2772213 RepID=A0ABR9P0A4_9ACTN|nr:ABC transporter substrate-binding protein [Nocardiopsis coralli]MBE2997280.1 ABC transporter substrate-binding protein [Nocardiopsis coralli]